MNITDRPELSLEEKKLPLAKYYDLPVTLPGPLQQQLIDYGCPIDSKLAIKPENFLDLLKTTGYDKVEYGYCMMEDGGGYIAIYTTYQNCTPQMLGWWFRWLNVHSKNMPKEKGNLKYKIWLPLDHYEHGFINGKDKSDGIYTIESLDLGKGEKQHYSIRYPFNLRDYGLTEKREQALKAAGCWVDCSYIKTFSLDTPHTPLPGSVFSLTLSRISPLGFMEKRSREWIGYGVKDGKVFRDKTTPASRLCEESLKKIIIHNTIEAQQLSKFLPELYAEYHNKPDDAD